MYLSPRKPPRAAEPRIAAVWTTGPLLRNATPASVPAPAAPAPAPPPKPLPAMPLLLVESLAQPASVKARTAAPANTARRTPARCMSFIVPSLCALERHHLVDGQHAVAVAVHGDEILEPLGPD